MVSRFNQILIGQGLLNQFSAHNVLARGLVAGLALGLLGIAPDVAPTAERPGLTWIPAAEAGTTTAVDAAQVASLGDSMQLGPLLAAIRAEGLADGDGLDLALLNGAGGARWQARAAAQAWLYPCMALAYRPLTDAEMDGYVDYLTSDAGKKANFAMFHTFDALFTGISHDVGLAVSRRLAGQVI